MARKTIRLQVLAVHLVIIIIIFLFPQKGSAESMVKSGCQDTCGNITIPYPFGIGSSCYLDPRFEITCDVSRNPHYPLLLNDIVVSYISLDYVLINHSISRFCYTNNTDKSLSMNSSVFPFSFSHTQNKFVAIGSGVFAFITQSPSKNYSTGCASLEGETLRYCSPKSGCSGPGSGKNFPLSSTEYSGIAQDSLPAKGYPGNPNNPYADNLPYRRGPYTEIISESSSICYGIYCCETAFPKDLTSFNMQLNTMQTTGFKSETEDICGYAFIAQTNFPVSYTISSSRKIVPVSEVVPAVLEWTVGNISCHEAKGREDYACGYNSSCVDSTQGSGYKCKCLIGYRGNPYLPTGCEDVDECKEPKNNICHEIARCVNIPGNYSCICPDGYHGDATKFGSGCIPVKGKLPVPLVVSLGIGIAVGLLILLAIAFWLYKRLEKRKKDILKRKFFDENGGRLLRHMMALSKGSVEKMKLYIIEELEKATDNFNVNRILGKGGFGTVYKGMLQDGSIVAVKKSDKVDEMQVDQFVNEVFILTQIDHSHIVKLLGCCLETEVPLLVYEHVSNGTLSHHLHDKGHLSTLSWENRLRIASEIADALDYLHSYGSAAIFHRDIKSNNILLDENLRAIVADFGISRPVSAKKTHLTASVLQGTYGYLDPEYFQTWQFTSKSDVYAFGVLLAELITGEKAICADRDKQGLASHFTSAMKSNDLFEIVDHTLVLNEDQKEEILVVARIAERCLEPTGDKRPTMKDVAGGLPKLRKIFLEQQVVE